MAGNPKGEEENVPIAVVLKQCNDIFSIQSNIISGLHVQQKKMNKDQECLCKELETERLKHEETKSLFHKEQDKSQLLETEISVVRKQLVLEKKTFEKAFGVLNNKSFRQNAKPEELITTITGLEVLCEQRRNELEKRDKQVKSLQMKLVAMATAHRKEKEELEKQLKQKVYLAHVRGRKFNQSLQ